jgi:hypothetical protein
MSIKKDIYSQISRIYTNNMAEKALNKTLPTQFDLQLKDAEKKTGISFVIRRGNSIEYVNIPTLPQQKHKYFYNPSSLTAEERKRILTGQLLQAKVLSGAEEDNDP